MAHIDIWSLIFLAIAPAVVLAAFAGRLKGRAIKAAALMVAAAPGVAIAYLAFSVWLRGDAGISAVGIGLFGLGLTAFAAWFGHRLSMGRGLPSLAAMSMLPITVFAFFYLRDQAARQASQSRVPTFEERVEHERLLRIRDEKRLEQAARELPALEKRLRRCAQDLSGDKGRTAARADHRQGKLHLMILTQKFQESFGEEIPGVD